ncbi:MAG TPA: aldehyde ferredoxin oxidoreductase family protein [Dehalococcoidia bacterium]|nr:aldehyde ferredoxin oxidoreductase family protein [Dehalococcoidia bacterium]
MTTTNGMMNGAVNGKMLNVRLNSGSIEVERVPEQMYRQYLGGYGIGARLLFDRIPAGADPLGPDNVLGLFPGLLTGTPFFGIRYQAVAKSPKNNGWGDANAGGDFGPYLKNAGWDGIMLYEKSSKPVYIYIEDDKVEIKDASDLWGMQAIDAEMKLKERHGKKASVACIGPAGEKLSLMAGICNERGRLAARSGLGAVMGSKNVKAIVVNASKNIIGSSPEIMKQVRQSLDEFAKPITNFFRTYGTTGITNSSAMSGDAPVKNWGGVGMVDFPQGMVMSGDNVNRRMEKKYACWHCPVACGAESHAWDDQENQAKVRIAKRETQINELKTQLEAAAEDQKQGIQAQIAKLENDNKADAEIKNDARFPYPKHTHRAEYETMTSFGTMMLNNDINALHFANHLCNQYGLDTIAAGATLAFAMECYENGLITKEDTDGIDLRWGNAEAIIAALHKIGTKEGAFGELFGDGVKAAAEKIGPRALEFAMEVGGEELPMHDPKLQPEYYTTYKLDPTPARHTQYEGAARPQWGFANAPQDRTQATDRGQHHKDRSEYMHIVNSAGMCMFIMMCAPNNRIPEWINTETGWDTSMEELRQVGERIANLRMAFAVREGDIVTKRRVPGRLWGSPPLEAGPHKDISLDTKTLEQEYLAAAGWDPETAAPSKAKLESLGLGDVAAAINAR